MNDPQEVSMIHTAVVQGLLAERDMEIINLRIRVKQLEILLANGAASEASTASSPSALESHACGLSSS